MLYVSKLGSDDNPGAFATPLRSVHKAAELSPPGAAVALGPGEWNRDVLAGRELREWDGLTDLEPPAKREKKAAGAGERSEP